VRLQAAQWFGEGRANAQIAAELRVGLRQVEKWRQSWRQGGSEALLSKGPHRRERLDDAAFARLEAELNRGPAAHGYADDQRWTLGRVAALIKGLFGVDYTLPGVSLLLRRHGSGSTMKKTLRPLSGATGGGAVIETRLLPV
jgi:transposase